MAQWKQHFDKAFQLFHVSRENLDGIELVPRKLSRERAMESEDWWSKRICVSSSISGALMAYGFESYDWIGQKMFVHCPIDIDVLFSKDNVYKPSTHKVPDAMITGEYWLKCKTMMKCIGQIQIDDIISKVGEDKMHYTILGSDCWVDEVKWSWAWRQPCKNLDQPDVFGMIQT